MAAEIFSLERKLVEYKSSDATPEKMAIKTARFCGTVNIVLNTLQVLILSSTKSTGHSKIGVKGDWTIIVSGKKEIFCRETKVI